MRQTPLLGILTDFGLADGYVGVMKAVILARAPGTPLIDISHDIAPQDVEMGAWTLGAAWRYFPAGSVFLCVVDPGVGSARRAVALAAHGRFFVGPDNGIFTYPLEERMGDEAPLRAVSLDNPSYHLSGTSATFHGRDIFAPCAAALAAGVPLAELGSAIEPATLARLPIARVAAWEGDVVVGRVAYVDHYGNLITNIGAELTHAALADPATWVAVAARELRARATHFAGGPADEPFFLQDSSGVLAIAVRDGSAATTLGARRGDAVTLHGLMDAHGA